MLEIQQSAALVPSAGAMERRRGRRFPLRLSCRLCPVSMQGAGSGGTVIDISRSGILLTPDSAETSAVLSPGDPVRVSVDLPQHPLFSPRCLECLATVVRVVVRETQTQVAVEIGRIRVRDRNPKENSTDCWFSAPTEGIIQ
jgi:hypothetical protein